MKQFWKVLFCAAVTALMLDWSGSLHGFVVQAQDGGTLPPSRQQATNDSAPRGFDVAETPAELQAKVQSLGSVRVIVGFNTSARFQPEGALSATQAQAQQTAVTQGRQALLQAIAPHNATLVAQSDQWTIPYVALQVDAAGLQALQASPQVASIREDGLNFQLNNTASLNNMNVPDAWAEGYDGSGYTVAILDNGVQGGHNFFGGRVVAEYCSSTYDNQIYAPSHVLKSLCPGDIYTQELFGLGASNPTACMDLAAGNGTNGIPGEYCDHGTHVAGIAAGNNGAPVPGEGVAKGANIIGVQVFTYIQCIAVGVYCSGDGIGAFDSNIIAGLQYVYDLRTTYPIASVNMSLGGGKYSSQSACDSRNPGMKAIIDQLRAANIATIIATGNSYYGDGISYPGCISSAIAVGSTSDSGESPTYIAGKISSFTNTNFMLDLLAPGYGINSSVTNPVNSFANKSGTSMASPQVAGAWAVVRTALPTASVTKILQAFQTSGTPVVDNVRADGYTCGYFYAVPCSGLTFKLINVNAAIGALMPTTPVLTAPLLDVMTQGKPTLTWTALRADEYDVRLDTVNPPVALLGTSAPSYTPATPLEPKVYYWQVKAYNYEGGESEWSEIRSFSVDVPAPRNYLNTDTATFTWSSITWATGYEIQIGTNTVFTGAPPPVPLSVSTFTYTTGPLSDGQYYWRVRAMNGALPGSWSAAEPFVIDFVP